MKVAILSDIHSNVYALKAVLKDAKKRDINKFINLGDTLYGPIQPYKTYKLLLKHKFIHICGNQDRQIFDASEDEIKSNPTLEFILDDISPKTLEWMKTHPKTHTLKNDIFLCHGTPNDDLTYLLEKIENETNILRAEKEILELIKDIKQKVILCGHSHTPRMIELSNGQIIINPGSVGLQAYSDDIPKHKIENHNSYASYVILEKKDDDIKVEFIRVSYKKEKAIKQAKKNNRKDWMQALEFGIVN